MSLISLSIVNKNNRTFLQQFEDKPPPDTTIVFFAIDPSIEPIPYGMSMICAKNNESYPYDLESVKIVYDPSSKKEDNSIYFITYIKPVPLTVPLFVHIKENRTFLSYHQTVSNIRGGAPPLNAFDLKKRAFDPSESMYGNMTARKERLQLDNIIYPESDIFWGRNIDPLYVITPEVFNDSKNINFICLNNTCVPFLSEFYNKNQDIYDLPTKLEPKKITKCLIDCKLEDKPQTLIEQIQQSIQSEPLFSNVNIKSALLLFIVILVIALSSILIFEFFTKKYFKIK